MGTNTGIGIGIGIPFRNNALGGDNIYFPPELKARMIGVWDNYGKKNTDADRNIIKNKIPNAGGDLEILNTAYKLNSGFGEYKFDFERWALTKPPTTCKKYNDSFNITYVGRPVSEGECIVETGNNSDSDIQVYFKVEISGIEDDMEGWFNTANFRNRQQLYNGINIINVTVNSKHWYGFDFIRTDGTALGNCNIVVKQIPAFEGALVTDGINDIIASIKTLEDWNIGNKGITIVSMIHQINTNTNNFITTNNIRTDNKVIGRNIVSNIEKTGIYGWYKENIQSDTINVINNILGDENDYTSHSSPSTNINPINNSKFYVQGYAVENGFSELSSVAHYWTFAVLGKATEDEINLIIAKYNLDRTLRPDILCNITKQGITNDNHSDFNDKLIDYSGNGRDIQMYNLAWKGGSGVAAKKFETIKDYLIVPDEGLQELTIYNEFSYKVKSIKHADRYWTIQTLNKTDVSYPITIVSDKNIIWRNAINYTDENGVKRSIRKETNVPANTPTQVFVLGFNDFDVPDNYTKVNCVAYATRTDITEFTVTFIPSCKGGILLDGIEDFGKVTGMPIYKDYTFIIDRQIITNDDSGGIVASKSESATDVTKQGAFIFEYLSSNSISTWSYYKNNSLVASSNSNRNISYQSKYSYNGKGIEIGEAKDSDKLWIGTIRDNDERFANIAIYSLMSFPYSMSKFLIERQLKKYKLGTLYPNMVEFRPIIKANNDYEIVYTAIIKPDNWQQISVGDYVTVGESVAIQIKLNNPLEVTNVSSNSLADVSFYKEETGDNIYTIYGRLLDGKSPQKISLTIDQDENYVLFNPTINSNAIFEVGNEQNMTELIAKVRNHEIDGFIMYLSKLESKYILPNSWINKDTEVISYIYCLDNILQDDLHINIDGNSKYCLYADSSNNIAEFIIMDDNIFEEQYITNVLTVNTIDIQLDQYIRYEDIVQPYPVLLRFNDENGNEVSWGGKFRVGSTITRIGSFYENNLLDGLYVVRNPKLNGNNLITPTHVVEKSMVFTCDTEYLLDNNEPKCILSPSRLRIPNSSYKLLGYIPDISGHGNHGVIHNSAYAEGSGVNEDGSYQFDGVDDFVTIPTVTGGGKQVLMKVNNNTINSMLYDQRSSGASPNSLYNDFAIYCTNSADNNQIAYQSRLVGNTYIDGILNTNIACEDLLGVLHNITITCDIVVPNNGVVPNIGRGGVLKDLYSKVALYDFMLFDNISTDDKIKELNEYVGIEAKVELPPYYWDAYGKTNLDEDKATIQQRGVAIGDYDLINNNFAYEGMSGYNGYPAVFGTNKTYANLVPNDGNFILTSSHNIINVTKFDTSYGLLYSHIKLDGKLTSRNIDYPSYKIKVTGLGENFGLHYSYLESSSDTTVKGFEINNDGIYIIPKSFASDGSLTSNSDWIGFIFTGTAPESCNVTIEVLPEYENGLVYDGVTDYSENANIPAFTDFTYILKRQILKGIANSAVMYKGNITVNQGGAFICNYCEPSDTNLFTDFSFGGLLRSNDIDKPIIYGTKTSVNGDSITPGENIDTVGINVGKWVNYLPMVLYKLILYPKTIPLLQINFLKNLMERDEIIDLDNSIFKK